MTTFDKTLLLNNADWYRKELRDNILAFWTEKGLDRINGGMFTCLDREGNLMDSTKSVWFQGRCAYVYSYAYNNVEKNPEWLSVAKSCIDFIEKYCIDPQTGQLYFSVTAEGKPLRKRRYVFSDCFAAIAMAEYAKASGDEVYAGKALDMFNHIRYMLNTPGFLEPKSMEAARGHSITMILINVTLVLKQISNDPVLDIQIQESIDALEKYFIHPEYKCILETVTPEGKLIDTCEGRTINPGHGIETAWFLMQAADVYGNAHYRELGLKIFDWQYEWGWDKEFGGIINFRDCKNFPPQDYSQDMKFWWPQCETILASLYAYKATHDTKYLDIYKEAHDWALKHLKDNQGREWFGYLHRDGSVAQDAKGNLFKGPFHIPRMLVLASKLCNQIIDEL
ncbi:MAG: AGE family epimerase/isomerase [Candidatus Cryptobacteroides sp.]